jgi:hypothetical protein
MRFRSATFFVACVLGAALATPANADIEFIPDKTFGCGTCTLLFATQGVNQTGGDGVTVQAHNGDGLLIDYTTTGGTNLIFAQGGQAQIEPVAGDTSFNNLNWSVIDPLSSATTWTAETFSVNVTDNGTINVLVNVAGGGSEDFDWAVSKNGENKIVLLASLGQTIESVFITALNGLGITSFRQDRIQAEGVPTVIPLPPALVLFGTALAGMGLLGRRRTRRGSEATS